MPNPQNAEAEQPNARSSSSEPRTSEYPVREYIGAMALELAQMARCDGDEPLAVMLDAAADRAAMGGGIPQDVLREAEPSIKRPS